MHASFFSLQDDQWFVGNGPARGPWDPDACHAGPVTGVIARALELRVTDKQLMRLSVEMFRPVPMAGFEVVTEIRKEGRMITAAAAQVYDQSRKLIASASSLHATVLDVGPMPSARVDVPDFSQAEAGEFPIRDTQHGLEFFGNGIEVRYPPGESAGTGPTTVWMKTLPLLETELPSPFQRLCPLADCGNGISRNMEVAEASFLNPDLSIVLCRAPESEWLASSARSFWEETGLGMTEATLFDTRGVIANATQTLLVQPR